MKGWKLWYAFQQWKCRRFGHRTYYEDSPGVQPHLACRRGCGPINICLASNIGGFVCIEQGPHKTHADRFGATWE